MKYTFNIPPEEQTILKLWLKEHKQKCYLWQEEHPFASGAIGGELTYSFTPTGIGIIIEVHCSCGEKTNITNFDNW